MTATPRVSGSAAIRRGVDATSPWPGLDAFREADSSFYRGRKNETDELFRLIGRAQLTVFFGPSGLGKTSLLQAGLFPRLREERYLPVLLRITYADDSVAPGVQVRRAIAEAASANHVEAPPLRDSDTLWECFHRREADFWSRDNYPVTPVLVFDQFEEIFTLGRDRADAFKRELADLIEGRIPDAVTDPRQFDFNRHRYKVVLSLREDFLPHLEGLREIMPSVVGNRLRLRPMTGAQALEVVAGSGLVADGVAPQIIRFVGGAGPDAELDALEIYPPLLSTVCTELNTKRLGRRADKITADLLEGTGTEILADFYERSFSPAWPVEVRNFVEDRLITASGYRDSVALDNIPQKTITDEVLSVLVDRRLLRVEECDGVQRLELTHDVLTGVIKASRDTRHQREEKEQAAARAQRARRQLRRAYLIVAVCLVFAAVSVAFYFRAKHSLQQEQRARSDLAWQMTSDLFEQGRGSLALEWAARGLRSTPDNMRLQSVAIELLLPKSWALPGPLMRHDGTVWSVVFSRDGKRVLTASADGTARVWNAATGKPISPRLQHKMAVHSAAFSPDGKRVVTASDDSTARIWDATTGDTIGPALHHGGPVKAAEFSPDGKRLVTASDDSTARIWDATTGDTIGPTLRHHGAVTVAVFSPDGRRVATASGDGTARVWNAATGDAIGPALRRLGPVRDVRFSPDGGHVVTASYAEAVIWDPRTGRPLHLLRHGRALVFSAEFSPDGAHVVTASQDSTAQVWDSAGRKVSEPLRHKGWVWSAAFSPDGERVLTTSRYTATAVVWDWRSGSMIGQPVRVEAWIDAAAFSPDARRVVTGSEDGTVRVWDWAQANPIGDQLWDPSIDTVIRVAFSTDGRRFMTLSEDSTVRVWDLGTGQTIGQPIHLAHRGWSAALSSDGRRVVTVLVRCCGAQVWDVGTGDVIGTRLSPRAHVNVAEFSEDGRRVVTAEEDTARIWEAATGHALGRPMPHKGWVLSAAFSADGRRVVTRSADGTAHLWDTTGRAIGGPLEHAKLLRSVKFSPDGRRVVTASGDGTARVWDATTGDTIGTPLRHSRSVLDATFSPNGKRVVTASEDGTARVWNVGTGAPVGDRMQHDHWVRTAVFSPDGRRVLTACEDGTARLWDAVTGQAISVPVRSGSPLISAAFTPDGRRVLTRSTDTTFQVGAVLTYSANEAKLLAELAEAVGGYQLTGDAGVVVDSDAARHLDSLRRATATDTGSTVRSVIRWFLTAPCARTISPLSTMSVAEYLMRMGDRASGSLEALCSDSVFLPRAELPGRSDSGPRSYRLHFADVGSVYMARLSLRGSSGNMYVHYRVRRSGEEKVVSQAMRVVVSDTGVFVWGSRPVTDASGRQVPTYTPDSLAFTILPDGTAKVVNSSGGVLYPVDLATTIQVENRCALPLSFAAVYLDADSGRWMRQGWWTVPPHAAVTAFQALQGHFYVYARADSANGSGRFMFTVNPKEDFHKRVTEALSPDRPRSVGFARVDLPPRRSLEYTYVFPCR